MGIEFTDYEIEHLLDQLLLIGEERDKVKKKVVDILNWEKGEECPVNEQELKDGIDGLEKLERFNHTRHMIFRDYVGPHSERVTMMHGKSQYIFQYIFGEKYNVPYGNFLASIHDILEGVSPFGDIITTIQETFTPESEAIVAAVEGKLAELVKEYFFGPRCTAHPQYTKQAFIDMVRKKTLPSQGGSYIDKGDGFMYTFHEIVAGNEHFIEYFQNYIARLRDIYTGKKLPAIQPLFHFSHEGYLEHLNEIHGDYPENMQHFGEAHHLYDRDMFLAQADRIDELLGICPPEKMAENLEEDFGFPAYRIWKQTMLLLDPIRQNRTVIRPNGRTLLTVPSRLIVPETL